jgi:D-alanyl-D-alanine carboxypeptidase
MGDDSFETGVDGAASRAIDRKAVLVGAAGGLFGITLAWPPLAGAGVASGESVAGGRFDPVLAGRLQQALDGAVAGSKGTIPGVILYAHRPGDGSWAGTAGLGRVDPDVAIRPGDRFRVGSIVKPFVAATVLQLVERGRLKLDDALTDVLPAEVTDRFPNASKITVRMLLDHRSGLPEWDSPAVDAAAARHPNRVWKTSDFLDLAAAKKPVFPAGTRYKYSNTDYTVLGLIIEHATGRNWRKEVTDRIIRPLALRDTVLPAPGNRSPMGPYAHAYFPLNGKLLDVSNVDPSFAGAAGANALVTTAPDLVRFLDGLLAGRLFRHPATLKAMLSFAPAPDRGGQVGYGLGMERRLAPGGVDLIGHLGGAVGYTAYVGRLKRPKLTFATAMNSTTDPSPWLLPVFQALANKRR